MKASLGSYGILGVFPEESVQSGFWLHLGFNNTLNLFSVY